MEEETGKRRFRLQLARTSRCRSTDRIHTSLKILPPSYVKTLLKYSQLFTLFAPRNPFPTSARLSN